MKKLILLLLVSTFSYGQAEFEKIALTANTTSSTATKVNVQEANGEVNTMSPENLPLSVIPPVHHFTPLIQSIKGYFQGVDDALGNLPATTAGSTTRLWYTADQTTITAGTFYKTNFTNKGIIANAEQSVINDDNQKKFFLQDLIGDVYVTTTAFPKGVYVANLSVSTSPNSAQQRFTIEVYRCNTDGTPIASGITGAAVGDLGVTVVAILDSGLLTLADAAVTNVPLSGILNDQFTVNIGERVRYHISAEKVGTTASNITEKVYFGTSYNSYIDVPVPLNTSSITNVSLVSGATTTDALNNLKTSIPESYSKIVYVNATNPNSATIFDLNNPPVTNDNALKADTSNLYIGTDASTWVYNTPTLNYITKAVIAETSNFYLSGTSIDAGNSKTAYIERSGTVKIPFFITDRLGVGGSFGSTIKLRLTGDLSGGTTSTGLLNESVVQSGVTVNAYYNRTFAGTQATSFTLPNLTHYMASQNTLGAGSSVTSQTGFHASNTLTGASTNYGFRGELPSSATNWNLYLDGSAHNYINGNVGIKTATPVGVLDVFTGLSGMSPSYSTIPLGTFVFGNFSTLNTVPTIYTKSNTSIGMALVAGTNDTNSEDFRFEVRENDGTDFATTTSIAYKFRRFNTTLFDILRNGNASLPLGNLSTIAGTAANHVIIKSQLDLKADIASPTFTGDPKVPTPSAGDNDASVPNTAWVKANSRPYKVYVSAIGQVAAAAPAESPLYENTLGGTIVWTRTSAGIYKGTLTGAFVDNKTICFISYGGGYGSVSTDQSISLSRNANDNEVLLTQTKAGSYADEFQASVEIRVYP